MQNAFRFLGRDMAVDLGTVGQGLVSVPAAGTAAPAFAGFPLDRFPVAGKTGTADLPPQAPFAWFASYAPAADPRFVVVVMVEQGGHGGESAAPVARAIYQKLFGLPQTRWPPARRPERLMRESSPWRHLDPTVILAALALAALGLAAIYSSTFAGRRAQGLPEASIMRRQLLSLGLGLVVMVAAMVVDYRRLQAWAPVVLGAVVLALGLVLTRSGRPATALSRGSSSAPTRSSRPSTPRSGPRSPWPRASAPARRPPPRAGWPPGWP